MYNTTQTLAQNGRDSFRLFSALDPTFIILLVQTRR